VLVASVSFSCVGAKFGGKLVTVLCWLYYCHFIYYFSTFDVLQYSETIKNGFFLCDFSMTKCLVHQYTFSMINKENRHSVAIAFVSKNVTTCRIRCCHLKHGVTQLKLWLYSSLESNLLSTPLIPNYKSFWFLYVHDFCYMHLDIRDVYTYSKSYVFRKTRIAYNLEWSNWH
jgi:hypothetical protein